MDFPYCTSDAAGNALVIGSHTVELYGDSGLLLSQHYRGEDDDGSMGGSHTSTTSFGGLAMMMGKKNPVARRPFAVIGDGSPRVRLLLDTVIEGAG